MELQGGVQGRPGQPQTRQLCGQAGLSQECVRTVKGCAAMLVKGAGGPCGSLGLKHRAAGIWNLHWHKRQFVGLCAAGPWLGDVEILAGT